MSFMDTDNEEIRNIFREIESGDEPHHDFLISFALAIYHADAENLAILKPAAIYLIAKYNLATPLAEKPGPRAA